MTLAGVNHEINKVQFMQTAQLKALSNIWFTMRRARPTVTLKIFGLVLNTTANKEKRNKGRLAVEKQPYSKAVLFSYSQGQDGSETFIYQHHSGISPRTFRVRLAENTLLNVFSVLKISYPVLHSHLLRNFVQAQGVQPFAASIFQLPQ